MCTGKFFEVEECSSKRKGLRFRVRFSGEGGGG